MPKNKPKIDAATGKESYDQEDQAALRLFQKYSIKQINELIAEHIKERGERCDPAELERWLDQRKQQGN